MIKMMLTPDMDRWERERGHPIITLAHDNDDWLKATEQQRLLLSPPLFNQSFPLKKDATL